MQEIVQAGLNTSCKINDGVNFQKFSDLANLNDKKSINEDKKQKKESKFIPCKRIYFAHNPNWRTGFPVSFVLSCQDETLDIMKKKLINIGKGCGVELYETVDINPSQRSLNIFRDKFRGAISRAKELHDNDIFLLEDINDSSGKYSGMKVFKQCTIHDFTVY